MNHTQRGVRIINHQQNFLNTVHYEPTIDSEPLTPKVVGSIGKFCLSKSTKTFSRTAPRLFVSSEYSLTEARPSIPDDFHPRSASLRSRRTCSSCLGNLLSCHRHQLPFSRNAWLLPISKFRNSQPFDVNRITLPVASTRSQFWRNASQSQELVCS